MIPFEYLAPERVEDAVQLLSERGGAALAGGTDLIGLMKDGLVTPKRLVDLRRIAEFQGIDSRPGGGLHIGALVTLDTLERHAVVRREFPVIAEAAATAGSPQLRNMGTVGGNLCQRPRCWYLRGDFRCLRKGGDLCYAAEGENEYLAIFGGGPCHIVHPSDLAPALVALDAEIAMVGPEGRRAVPIGEFFLGVEESLTQENVLRPGELIAYVMVPGQPAGARGTFLKAMDRGAWSFATASVAVQLTLRGSTVGNARIVLGGVAPRPWRAEAAERVLMDAPLSDASISAAAAAAVQGARPMSQNGYKVPLVHGLVERALRRLTEGHRPPIPERAGAGG